MNTNKIDIVIIGGGISGSLFALNLIKNKPDFKIAIIEKNAIFHSKVGEATADISSTFLNKLSINEILKKQQRKTGLRFLFNEGNSPQKKNNKEFASPVFKSFTNGYHLNRAVFDEDLLQACRNKSITVYRPAIIEHLEIFEDNSDVTIKIENDTIKLNTTWLVDASGKARYIKNTLKWKDEKVDLNTSAISCYLENLPPNSSWDRKDTAYWTKNAVGTKDYSTIHFLRPHCWWWLIKIDKNRSSLGMVFDKQKIDFENYEAFFNETIQKDSQLSLVTKGAEISPPTYFESLPYVCSNLYQHNIVLLGDSGAFIDPLFSPGMDLICQQNASLTELIIDYYKTGKKNTRKWERYELRFKKTYHNLAFIYKRVYNYTESYDVFTNFAQLSFFGYQSFLVLPLKLFPKRIKNTFRLNFVSKLGLKFIFKRYDRIINNRLQSERGSSSLKQPITYSKVKIPNGLAYYLKPGHLFIIWFWNYLKMEASNIFRKRK